VFEVDLAEFIFLHFDLHASSYKPRI